MKACRTYRTLWRLRRTIRTKARTNWCSTTSNSGAIRNPSLIPDAALKYGSQCVVLSADVKRVDGSFHVFSHGGRIDTGMDALEWIRRGVELGAGEVVLNSIDTDGVKQGFDLEMLNAVTAIVDVPVIASGGAGCMQDFVTLFRAETDPGRKRN